MAEDLVHWGQIKNSPGDGDLSRLYTPPAMRETLVQSLGREDPLEKAKATHYVFWPREFHRLYSLWGHNESDTTERLSLTYLLTQ